MPGSYLLASEVSEIKSAPLGHAMSWETLAAVKIRTRKSVPTGSKGKEGKQRQEVVESHGRIVWWAGRQT